jgi:hypothetical protein
MRLPRTPEEAEIDPQFYPRAKSITPKYPVGISHKLKREGLMFCIVVLLGARITRNTGVAELVEFYWRVDQTRGSEAPNLGTHNKMAENDEQIT